MSFNYQFVGRMSCVAGIVDHGGGIRVVVTYPELLQHHVAPGERGFKVPDLWVQEPVGWNLIPDVIQTATDHVFNQLNQEAKDNGR